MGEAGMAGIAWLAAAIAMLMAGHYFRILRWEAFIQPYERPPVGALFRSLSIGYGLNMVLPFRAGDIFRVAYVGRRMESGTGFALATVIFDRFLDVVAVALIFLLILPLGDAGPEVLRSALAYEAGVVLIGAAMAACRVFSRQVKRAAASACSIFNDTIRLEGMRFFWSLINTFRNYGRISVPKVLGRTAAMWALYVASYGCFAMAVSGTGRGIVGIIVGLFSDSSLGMPALAAARDLGGGAAYSLAYTAVPPALLWLATLLPGVLRHALGMRASLVREEGEETIGVLPQVDERDQMRFLDDYFNSSNREYIRKFIEMNRDVSILRDYSAGSNATTLLCMNREETFYRKYAFGADGEKLGGQLEWLERHRADLPLCEILRSGTDDGYCFYDMAYDGGAHGMFRYMHSKPPERSWEILRSVLDRLEADLYGRSRRAADAGCLDRYLDEKVDRNLEKIRGARILADLVSRSHIVINGRRCKNLPLLEGLFDHDYLRGVFARDEYADIHGDLTIENIVCLDRAGRPGDSYYLIDPNTGNIHDSPYLDYGKLLQSLHGGYEFMMMAKSVRVEAGRVDFLYTRSAVYDETLGKVEGYLLERLGGDGLRSVFHHELIHWLRLMPYKLENDRKRAAMFYAGLVLVANDIDERYG